MYILKSKNKQKGRYLFTLDSGNEKDWIIRVSDKSFKKYDISDDVNVKLLISDDYDYLYDKALSLSLHYLGYKMRTEQEMKDYLYNKNYVTDVIDAVIDRLKELRYIDDKEYIKNYTRARKLSGDGKIKIRSNLLKKNVNEEWVQEVLYKQYSEEDEIDGAYKVISKVMNRDDGAFYKDKKNKAMNAAVRKGYPLEVVSSVINEFDYEEPSERAAEKQRKKIADKIKKVLAKEEDIRKAKYKVKAFFYAKGADDSLVEEIFSELVDE